MKKTIMLAALALSLAAFGTGYQDWFTPSGGWSEQTVPVNIQVAGESFDKELKVIASLSDCVWLLDAITEDIPSSAKNAFQLSKAALANALYASCQARMNKIKIDNLGAAMEGVFVSTYGKYVDENGNVITRSRSGVDTSKLRAQLLANKNAVVSGGTAAGGSESKPLTIYITQKPYDEHQFEQHTNDGKSLTSLKGWYDLAEGGSGLGGADGWAFATLDWFLPTYDGDGEDLKWRRWNGWSSDCFSAGEEGDDRLTLAGWDTANNCGDSIQYLLTNSTFAAASKRTAHKILTRYDNGEVTSIHWMPFDGTTIGGGSEVVTDEKTLEYTRDAGATEADPKKLRLYGWETAKSGTTAATPKIPYVDGSDTLVWKGLQDFFNAGLFETRSDGKIALKGVNASGNVRMMTVAGNGDNAEIVSVDLSAITDDPLEVDSEENKLTVTGWSDADPASSDTLAGYLTNGVGYVNNPAQSPSLLTRTASGEVTYTAIGRLPDFKDGYTPVDGKTITTNTSEGAETQGIASLYGWDTANTAAASNPKNAKIPFADGSNTLQWKKPSAIFNDNVFTEDSDGKIVLKSTVEETGKTEVMTITQTSGTGGVTAQTIEGKSLASLTDGNSLDRVPVDGNDRIGLKNWNSPSTSAAAETLSHMLENGTGYVNDPSRSPAVVVRNNGALQYMALGRTKNALESDETSVTTNYSLGASIAGKASLRGYREADNGSIPVKGAEHLEWARIAPADGHSIVTNESVQIALKGFDEAQPEEVGDGVNIPYRNATSDDLEWAALDSFFADSVFRKSETTGKILLNGTSEEGKVKVLAMTGTGGDDQTVSGITFDGESIDGVVGGVVQLHNFGTPVSPYVDDSNFADALTNTATQITGMSVPVRVPQAGTTTGYNIKYVPMGKVTGIPSAAVDNITIETNATDPQNPYLQLHGAAGEGITLAEGQVYQIGSDGKGKFAKLGGDGDDSEVTAENASIETYTGEDGGKYFRLRDWMLNREGEPHLLGWQEHELKYWEANGKNGIDVNNTGAGDEITLSNFDTAHEGGIPYAKTDGNGLGWLNGVDDRIPLLHADDAPTTMAIGASLDKANISAVPTLNVAGFTSGGNCDVSLNSLLSDPSESDNRSKHQIMTRYSGGDTPAVHWMGIDDVVGGVADIEAGSGISITSNGTTKVIAHNLVAGAGISLTPTGTGTGVTIASATPTAGTVVDPHAEEITFLTELWYDNTTHQIKAKRITAKVMVIGTLPTAQEFVAVQCTAHSDEHTSE